MLVYLSALEYEQTKVLAEMLMQADANDRVWISQISS